MIGFFSLLARADVGWPTFRILRPLVVVHKLRLLVIDLLGSINTTSAVVLEIPRISLLLLLWTNSAWDGNIGGLAQLGLF